MCGIAGIYSKINIDRGLLVRMTDCIAHRGPDGDGHWINSDKSVGLGHKRLAIIDLSANGCQPMHYNDNRYTITFNGEIYNYIELKNELIQKGYIFNSNSDTEVLLALFDNKREKCLQYLNGMFSFAIWDEKYKELFCARDRFGEKPFYYYKDANSFVFASEIKQLFAYGIEKKVKQNSLRHFIEDGEVINRNLPEETFYDNILCLQPANYLILNSELKINITNYWSLDKIKVDKKINFHEAISEFGTHFHNSLSIRLRSDVPVGSSLSGGLDSSCIVNAINSDFLKNAQAQHTFSARFYGYEKDEGEYIDAATATLKNIHRHEVFLNEEDFESTIHDIIHFQDEPFQSASIFAQYKVMQLAKNNNVKVLLDGQGADELLGGYEPLYIPYLKQLFFNNINLYKTEKEAFNKFHGSKYGHIDYGKDETLTSKLRRVVKNRLHVEQPISENYFSNILKEYITGPDMQQLLRYADRNSMANSVEVRLPYLDHKLVEFVFSLPDEFKLKAGWPKYLLRKAFENRVPDKIIWRVNKVGFETPEYKFLKSHNAKTHIKRASELYSEFSNIKLIQSSAIDWRLFMLSNYVS